MSHEVKGFASIIGKNPKLLILGTMPSVISLASKEYYAHPRNAFWPIIFSYFDVAFEKHSDIGFDCKKTLLRNHQIALWDVLANCQRKGSLDSNIKQEIANDIAGLITQKNSIKYIICNGQLAYKLLKKHQRPIFDVSLNIKALPSTSAANASMSYEKKRQVWHNFIFQIISNKKR